MNPCIGMVVYDILANGHLGCRDGSWNSKLPIPCRLACSQMSLQLGMTTTNCLITLQARIIEGQCQNYKPKYFSDKNVKSMIQENSFRLISVLIMEHGEISFELNEKTDLEINIY